MNEENKEYWSKENIRKRLREKSKENLVKRKHDQVISSNIINCVLSFLCCCVMMFNFHNSKTMLALFCFLFIGLLMIISSLDVVKCNSRVQFIINFIISLCLAVIFLCNQQEITSEYRGYYDSYIWKVVVDQCANFLIIATHSFYLCGNKYWYIFLGYNVVNLVILYFNYSWLLILSSIILLSVYVFIFRYLRIGRPNNE